MKFNKQGLLVFLSCVFFSVWLGGASCAKPAKPIFNGVFNGDFELFSDQNPPSGWEMWGAQKYKDPDNYVRDTTNPHSGKACLRIYHPAGTNGYIVSSPKYPIRTKKGKSYAISFWARSDKPGRSLFGLSGYESIQPFVGAPAPTFSPIEVGQEWKRFAFEIKEGLDFFADRARYLLLTFKATTVAQEEMSLWIDDVMVTEGELILGQTLIDERTLSYAPLQHRLKPGPELAFTVDVRNRLRRVPQAVGGVAFHRLAGYTGQPFNQQGQYTLSPVLEKAIHDLQLPMTRFFGLGDEPFSLEEAIDKTAEVCRRLGIPQNQTVLEFEPQNGGKLAPEVWARGVSHSLKKGYRFRYWEIANEPERTSRQTVRLKREGFRSAEDYLNHFLRVSKEIRKLQPQAQIGLPISDSPMWGSYLLNRAAGHYDFVVGHYYAVSKAHLRRFEVVALTENFKVLDEILRINELIRLYNPGREVYQLDTEWGMHSGGPNDEPPDEVKRNGNIFGTLHRAVRLIYYAREGLLRGATSWNLLSHAHEPGFGFVSQEVPDQRSLLYWLYYYFNRHLGEWVLDLQGTAPYYYPTQGDDPLTKAGEFPGPLTPPLVTLSKDGKNLYLVMANGSWERSIPGRIEILNFKIGRTEGVLLSHHDPDGRPLLERKEEAITPFPVSVVHQEMSFTLPPHSVVFISLRWM